MIGVEACDDEDCAHEWSDDPGKVEDNQVDDRLSEDMKHYPVLKGFTVRVVLDLQWVVDTISDYSSR